MEFFSGFFFRSKSGYKARKKIKKALNNKICHDTVCNKVQQYNDNIRANYSKPIALGLLFGWILLLSKTI